MLYGVFCLASGYLKVEGIIREHTNDTPVYQLKLTNFEVKQMFSKMIRGWFKKIGDLMNLSLPCSKVTSRNESLYEQGCIKHIQLL